MSIDNSPAEPQMGEEWNRNLPAVHFSAVIVRGVSNGIVEFAPCSCWYDPNTTFISKVESFRRNYTRVGPG